MDFDDASDLLGNNEMPVRQQRRSLLSFSFYFVFWSLVAIVLFVAYHNGRSWLRSWREYNYRKSVRRKYGIPDSSNEPFNVAYAKAEQRRKEMAQRMAQQQATSQASTRSAAEDVSSGKQEGAGPSMPRRRIVPAAFGTGNVEQSDLNSSSRSFAAPQNAASKPPYNGMHSQMPGQSHTTPKTRPEVVAHDYATTPSQRKRSLEKDDADESSKKPRNDSSKRADFTTQDSSMDVADDEIRNASSPKPSRGAKRQAGSDEEIANAGSLGKKAGKRARRQSKKLQDVLNGDENDELMDLDHISRGKKRDRTEAGSSFGGDDDSPAGGRGRKNRRQKRKSNASMDIEAAVQARGTKRGFEVESTLGSDDEDGSIGHSRLSRKRGKRMGNDQHDTSDVSMDDSVLDLSRAGHKIGEEWHANGETFKAGPDGRRLRQVLLRKRRSRFSMPEDSQHPDTQAHLEILIETWLNDDDFKAAEERGDVFIPDKESEEARELISSSKAGKQLLWSTPQKGVTSPKKAFRNSIVANVGVNSNPFERPSLGGYSKRVSIGADSSLPSPTASPAIRQSKSYSKWEKQDLEAEAMAKLRKKLEEEKKVATPISKKVSFQIPSSGTESSSSAPVIASSSSAPATLPASSMPSKTDAPASTPSADNLFALPSGNRVAAKVPSPSTSTTAASEPSQNKPPTITFTPPPPSKDPASAPATKTTSVNAPFGSQPMSTSSENNRPSMIGSKPDDQAAGPSVATPSMPNSFGMKTQGISNAAASSTTTNAFTKPIVPSNTSTPVLNGTSGGASEFSFGNKDVAQGEKFPAVSTPLSFAFGKSPGKAFSSATSPFSAPAKETHNANVSNAFGRVNGSAAGGAEPSVPATALGGSGAATRASPFSFGAPSNQASGPSSAPTEQPTSGSGPAAPKFNFGFGSKPAASPLPSQAPASSSAPKSASSSSPFSFASAPATQNLTSVSAPTPAASSTTSAPRFSFGTSAAPSSSSAAPAAASNAFGGNTGTTMDTTSTAGTPAATGFSFNFGGSKPATSSSTPSAFGNPSSSSSSFGSTTKTLAPSPSPFGNAPSTFSSAPNAAMSSPSPFAAPTQSAGEAPKPLFGFGSNGTTSSTSPAAEKQDNKPGFSFNFGAAPATSTPTFGTAPSQSGASTANAFGNAAGSVTPTFSFGAKPAFGTPAGNTNSSNTPSTNVFGSTSGTSAFGGQK